jgi:metal-dependent HD superfamily phosphatase/phosphodiesterase
MMWVMPGVVLLGAASLPLSDAAIVAGVFAVAGGLRLFSGRARTPWSYILHGSWHIVAALDAVLLVYLTV